MGEIDWEICVRNVAKTVVGKDIRFLFTAKEDMDKIGIEKLFDYKETLIKVFPVPDLRRQTAISMANPCTSTEGR